MKKILFLLAVSFFAFQLTCFAAITITENKGIIKIIPPGGGTAIIVKPGQSIPAIADGSTIELLTNSVTVTTTAPSTVILSILGNKIALSSGSTVQGTLDTNGAIKVYDSNGLSTVKTLDGKTSSLKPGQTIIIAGNVEAYTPPPFNGGPLDQQVHIQEATPLTSADASTR